MALQAPPELAPRWPPGCVHSLALGRFLLCPSGLSPGPGSFSRRDDQVLSPLHLEKASWVLPLSRSPQGRGSAGATGRHSVHQPQSELRELRRGKPPARGHTASWDGRSEVQASSPGCPQVRGRVLRLEDGPGLRPSGSAVSRTKAAPLVARSVPTGLTQNLSRLLRLLRLPALGSRPASLGPASAAHTPPARRPGGDRRRTDGRPQPRLPETPGSPAGPRGRTGPARLGAVASAQGPPARLPSPGRPGWARGAV